MVSFKAEIERFASMGEKTGWTYVFIPQAIALQIKPDCRKSFRVKGKLDNVPVEGMAFVPMGEGDFILALNGSLRKQLKKEEGDALNLELEEDKEFKIEMPHDLELCLSDEKHFIENFLKMPKSHQNYFINWLNTAKTDKTRTKRLAQIVMAMDKKMNFGEMIRAARD
jgi:hypothetical protein